MLSKRVRELCAPAIVEIIEGAHLEAQAAAFEAAYDEACAEGRAEALALVLRKRLRHTLGPLCARLAGASAAELDKWLDRLLDDEALGAAVADLAPPATPVAPRPRAEFAKAAPGQQLDRMATVALSYLEERRRDGIVEGYVQALLLLLEKRFGAVPEPLRERVMQASGTQLQRWFDRILDVKSIEALFAET